MAGNISGESSHHGSQERDFKVSQDKPEEGAGSWYFSRKEIEENSPSRHDGIELKQETLLRKSYCTYLRDMGMKLKMPQVATATSITFCHRFFLRQSHAKNDRRVIATACMYLAGKVEETPRSLNDVVLASYEIIYKQDAVALVRIKQKEEVFEQQKELILLAEKVVLATLGFDLNVHHPYKPLNEAIKKFKVDQKTLAGIAWNFVNDGFRTTLCLQFQPDQIAAGAIFLAARFLKMKLPSDSPTLWWQELNVTPRQLHEISCQIMELHEQNRAGPSSQTSEAEGSSAGGSQRPPLKVPPGNVEHFACSSHGGGTSKVSLEPEMLVPDQPHAASHSGPPSMTQTRSSDDYGTSETNRNIDHKDDTVGKSPQDATKNLDQAKLKAAFQRRKARGVITKKTDPVDELETQLEDVELPSASEKIKHEIKEQSSNRNDFDKVEEGEVEPFDDVPVEGKQQNDHASGSQKTKSPSPSGGS